MTPPHSQDLGVHLSSQTLELGPNPPSDCEEQIQFHGHASAFGSSGVVWLRRRAGLPWQHTCVGGGGIAKFPQLRFTCARQWTKIHQIMPDDAAAAADDDDDDARTVYCSHPSHNRQL